MKRKKKNKIPDVQKPASAKAIKSIGSPFSIGIAVLALFVFVCIWAGAYQPTLSDSWNAAAVYLDSSKKTNDSAEKIRILDIGGNKLHEALKKHPYHARIWYLYGYYLSEKQLWDSAINCEKRAIELGAGGTVNQVEFVAADRLCYALTEKIKRMDSRDTNSIASVLNDAEVRGFENTSLIKLKGIIYTDIRMQDSAMYYLQLYSSRNRDADVMYYTGINQIRSGDKVKAIASAKMALEINKDHAGAQRLLNELNNLKP